MNSQFLDVEIEMPEWIAILNSKNEVKKSYIESIRSSVDNVDKLRDIETINTKFLDNPNIEKAYISNVDAGTGVVTITLTSPPELYSRVLRYHQIDVSSKAGLLSLFQEYNEAKKEYDRFKYALKMVKKTGYGIANPTIEDMKLDKPEVIKQGSRYGIKLKAVALRFT